jgi:hypothetical protein
MGLGEGLTEWRYLKGYRVVGIGLGEVLNGMALHEGLQVCSDEVGRGTEA